MEGIIRNLYHYPIKGLSAQPISNGGTAEGRRDFPFDRVFGFARYDSGFDVERSPASSERSFHCFA